MTTRRWLIAGLAGALLVIAFSPARDLWQVNMAGVLINRAHALARLEEPDHIGTVQWQALLRQAAASLEQIAGPDVEHPAGDTGLWRTYGAAVTQMPSERSFERMLGAWRSGLLDRVGKLWFGAVASATGHWTEAEYAYSQVDASNLLIQRGDTAVSQGLKEPARRFYLLALASMNAARERQQAREILLGPTDPAADSAGGSSADALGRTLALYRVGRGLLQAGDAANAVPVLEEARLLAETTDPGARTVQATELALARGLAETLPAPGSDEESGRRQTMRRIGSLLAHALALGETGAAHLQAGRTLLLVGEEGPALVHLQTALALEPHLADAYLALGAMWEGRNDLYEARAVYRQGAEALPANVAIAAALANVATRTMGPQRAIVLLLKAVDMGSTDPYVFANLGDCYLRLGHVQKARVAYLRGLSLSPGFEPLITRVERLTRPNLVPGR